MIIEKIDPTRESFKDYFAEGTLLTIAGNEIDLAEEEGDQEVIIQFGACNGKVHRGITPSCTHVVDVIIPPRKYETVEVDGPPQGTSRNSNDDADTHNETIPVPIDMESVTLKLWPVVDDPASEINHQEEVEINQEEENVAE